MIVVVARPEPGQFIAQLRRDLQSPPLFFSRRVHPGNKAAAEAERLLGPLTWVVSEDTRAEINRTAEVPPPPLGVGVRIVVAVKRLGDFYYQAHLRRGAGGNPLFHSARRPTSVEVRQIAERLFGRLVWMVPPDPLQRSEPEVVEVAYLNL